MQKAFLSPLLRAPHEPYSLVSAGTGRVLANRVAAALDSKTRNRGLLGRDQFDPGEALIIAPTNAVHTFFMRFPIDIAFLKRDGSVVGIRHRVKPWRLAFALRGYLVVELPAGTLDQAETRVGDVLRLAATGT